jgi:hypothetical protein
MDVAGKPCYSEMQLTDWVEAGQMKVVAEARSLDRGHKDCKRGLARRPTASTLQGALRQRDCEQCTDVEE